MSLSYSQIQQICQEIASRLIGKKLLDVLELSGRKFIFNFGEDALLICLQDPFLRLHLTKKRGKEASLKITRKMRQLLLELPLLKIKILNEDRSIALEFKQYQLVVELFSKRPNLYLIAEDGSIIDALNPVQKTLYSKKQQAEENGSRVTSRSIEMLYSERERDSVFLSEKNGLKKHFEKEKKRLLRRINQGKEILKRAEGWEKAQHEALLLQGSFYQLKKGLKSIFLEDWKKEGKKIEIFLDPLLEPKEEIAKRFRYVRKLKTSIPYILKEMQKSEQQLVKCEQSLQKIDQATLLEELKPFQIKKKEKFEKDVKTVPYREYTSSSGLKIWVGKSAVKNDQLTFSYARGFDWWLHVSGFSGSHVILRVNKNENPDQESLKDAIQLALYYSKAKDLGGAEVCITQRKYVSRFGKVPGKVQLSKHKIVYAKLEIERFDRIKNKV